MALWGSRFEKDSDPLFRKFNDSLPYDWRLVQEDIEGSIAWAQALEKADVLSATERKQIESALKEIAKLAAETPESAGDSSLEDVHTWVEAQLIERLGDVGKKLHTGRSRNDQVATDLRLWTRRALSDRQREIHDVQDALLGLAARHECAVLPGYTHLQHAQPILFAHWCLAYFEMLQRDRDRFADADRRTACCPLGSGALAGTAYPIDREALAHALRFHRPTSNSLDAVSDRDFVVETLSASALCGIHLSRLAEDLIFYAGSEVGFVELDDSTTTGSSMMPQKKNPDALELVRGKTGRLFGSLTALCMTLKGLPLAYNKDLQEDKAPLFDAMDTLSMCLKIVTLVLDRLRICEDVSKKAAAQGYTNATDLADYLVGKDVPFREAHDQVGQLVRIAIERDESLDELPMSVLTRIAPKIEKDAHVQLTVDASLNKRNTLGGTAPAQVSQAMKVAHRRLARNRDRLSAGAVEVRQACIDDLNGICQLVNYWAEQGENLPRKQEAILEGIQDFGVAVADGKIVGCGSLTVYTPVLAEIRSLGVDPDCRGNSVGSMLVQYFIRSATALHIPRVFVLTRGPKFFERLGFREERMNTLPEKVWKDCVDCPKRDCCDEIPMIYEINT